MITLSNLIIIAPLAFFILAVVVPLIQALDYNLRLYQFQRTQRRSSSGPLGSGSPIGRVYTRHSFPLGIPAFVTLLRANRNNMTPETLRDGIRRARNRLTHRRQIMGRYVFFTIDPQNVRALLATQFDDFALGPRSKALSPLLGAGVFTVDGEAWRHARAMLRPQFARDQVERVDMLGPHVDAFLRVVERAGRGGLDLQQLLFQLTLDTATKFLFGESVGALGQSPDDSRQQATRSFGDAFTAAQRVLAHRVRAQGFCEVVTVAWPGFGRWCEECRAYTERFVSRALAGKAPQAKEGQYVFLEELAKKTRDPGVLRDAALNVLLAGRDTTASSLAWIFYHLACDWRVQSKLRSVLREQFAGGSGERPSGMTFEALKRCTYLQHVIKETLRLHPSVPINVRTATRDTTLPRGGRRAAEPAADENGAVFVPKGSSVFYSPVAMHTHAKLWRGSPAEGTAAEGTAAAEETGAEDEVLEFVPERWARDGARGDGWRYIPFNGGPRICLGQQFALTELAYVVARTVLYFGKIEVVEGKMGGWESGSGDGRGDGGGDGSHPSGRYSGKIRSDAQLTMSVAGGVWVRAERAERAESRVGVGGRV